MRLPYRSILILLCRGGMGRVPVAALAALGCRGDFQGAGESSDGTNDTSTEAGEGTSGSSGSGTTGTGATSSSSDGATDSDSSTDTPTASADYALSFDGEGVGLSEATSLVVLPVTFTVEFWMRTSPSTYGYILDTIDDNYQLNTPNGWVFYQGPWSWTGVKDKLVFIDYGHPSWEYMAGPDLRQLAPGWHHFAVTHDGMGTSAMFVDGQPFTTVDILVPQTNPVAPLSLGKNRKANIASGEFPLFDAAIDDLRISSVVRYIDAFVPDSAPEQDDDTVLLFRFNEGEGDVSMDDVAGLELELSGVAWVSGS